MPAMPPIMVFMKASCCLRNASNPGMPAIGVAIPAKFSIILVWLSRSISKLEARNCGITACILVA